MFRSMISLRKSSQRDQMHPESPTKRSKSILGRHGGDPQLDATQLPSLPEPPPPCSLPAVPSQWGSPSCPGGTDYCSSELLTLLQVCPSPHSLGVPQRLCERPLCSALSRPVLTTCPTWLRSHPSPNQTLRSMRTGLGVSQSIVQSTCHGAVDMLNMLYKMAPPVTRKDEEQMKLSPPQY